MAQGTTNSDGELSSPEEIRAAMAKTREHIAGNLDVLKKRVLGESDSTKRKRRTVTKKKEASNGNKKKSSVKKSKGSHSPVKTKAKAVLGNMLKGAAVGAVKGAAEAVMPERSASKHSE
jgi:hypothetical protein